MKIWKKREKKNNSSRVTFQTLVSIVWLCQQLSADFEAIYSWKKQGSTFLPSGFEWWPFPWYNVTVLYMSYSSFKLQPWYSGKRGKSLTAFFYLQSSWEVGRRPLTQKEQNNDWGCVCVRKGSWWQALLKCPQILTHYYTNFSSADAGGRTKWKRVVEETENRANLSKIGSCHP